MGLLLARARPHALLLTVGLLLALAGSVAGLAQPLGARAVIDTLGGNGALLQPVLVLCGLVVVSAICNGANSYLLGRTGERVVFDVRRRLAGRLVRLRTAELDARSPGDLISRATSDTTWIRQATTTAPVGIVNGTVGLLGALILMAVLDVRLFAVTSGVLVAIGLVVGYAVPRIRAATQTAQSSVGIVGSALDRALGAIRTVKAAGAESREQATVEDAAERAYRAGLTGVRWTALLAVVAELSLQVSFLAVLGVGGGFVAAGSLPVSTLVAFLLYLFYIAGPLTELVTALTALQQGLGAANRLTEVEEMAVEEDTEPGHAVAAVRTPPPALRFEGVRFGYPGREDVLHDVTFEVPAGKRVALVGPSGSGKTTLLSLVLRFHDPLAGTIRLDSTDLTTIRRADVRRRIGYVEQDAAVVEGTLRENLLYAAAGADDAELRRAAQQSCLDELVDRLPDGLDSAVGARGITLSGGERQRIAIARALLRRPGLLLLDEATAHLDARTEDAMSAVLTGRDIGCTVLVVAHRLATVRDADLIVVVDRGRVRARGTHAELLATDPLYREFTATQLAAENSTANGGAPVTVSDRNQ
ncbi:ABC transporter ATP-binding protein (plasmid) [Pseudonocardia sp. EC080625-04]|uniref:ABC transporter ATP-binding protein n=2 Tax=unclassified Pseudonocardia TaxID=2619320 RepID=UPI0006CB65E4|nr:MULTISPECIES: ABC transporter ATP-binding protein [unclassified Pseudonocardia]ALE76974.1 ABC transporter ATP-binding protein [Pseudonocardia sp. EC080625-04]ALL85926.1 ABC transporter ATP-binding protein [Pseudonocardia sp. EC080619-01]